MKLDKALTLAREARERRDAAYREMSPSAAFHAADFCLTLAAAVEELAEATRLRSAEVNADLLARAEAAERALDEARDERDKERDQGSAYEADLMHERDEARAVLASARAAALEEAARWFDAPECIEARSAEAHGAYQIEAHRRGDVRHADTYAELAESTKEWDRVLVRWVARTLRALAYQAGRPEVDDGE